MATRDELVVAIAARYAQGCRRERGIILDEFLELVEIADRPASHGRSG